MKKSRLFVLTLAVAAAGGAFVLANAPRPQQTAVVTVAAPPVAMDDVLVAARDIPLGTIVGDADLVWQPWPKAAAGPSMIVKAADPRVVDDLRGAIARASLFQGEPIRREKLIKGNGSGFVSAILPSGMRAVAINIDTQGGTSAGGFIHPNDHVDVVRTYHDDTTKPGAQTNANTFVSETILHNVKVLAIGQNLQDKDGQPVVVGSNATLELDPVQAESIILAQRIGQLSLTLRSIQDANQPPEARVEKADNGLTVVRFGYAADGGVH